MGPRKRLQCCHAHTGAGTRPTQCPSGLVVVLLGAFAFFHYRNPPAPVVTARFEIPPPERAVWVRSISRYLPRMRRGHCSAPHPPTSGSRPLSFVLRSTGHPVSPAALSRKKEANEYGDRDLPLCCWYVSGEIRRVHQVIEKGRGGQPVWPFVPCVFWTERQSDGVRCLVIAGGVRQVREDADAHPSTTRDRLGKAGSDARAQGDLAGTEGHGQPMDTTENLLFVITWYSWEPW